MTQADTFHRLRRILLTGLEIGLWCGTVGLAILLGTFVALGQGWGSGVVHRVLTAVSAGFLGRIEVGTARVFVDGTVLATNATIFDPQGHVVIHVDALAAHVDLRQLLHQELDITSARASGVNGDFVVDDTGALNIARTFQPRHPGPPTPPAPKDAKSGGGFAVVVDGINVQARRVTLVIAPSSQPLAEVRDAHLQGRLEVTRQGEVIISPQLNGASFQGPLSGPLTVAGRMSLVGPVLTADAEAHLADSSLRVAGAINLSSLSGQVEVRELLAGPETLSTWLRPQRPRGARLTLAAVLSDGLLRLDSLRVEPLAGEGGIDLQGSLALNSGDGEVHIRAQGVNARALFAVLPNSDIGFHLDAGFARIFSDARSGKAHLTMDPWRWDGELVGPGGADVTYAASRLGFTNLDLSVPGARVMGQGSLAGQHVDAQLRVRAPHLGQVRAAIQSIARLKLPAFDGDARVEAHIEGVFSDLAVNANLSSMHFSLGGLSADNLAAQLQAPHISRRMNLQGHVTLGELHVADESFEKIDLNVGWQTPEFALRVRASTRGQAIEVWTRGQLAANFERAEVEELTLSLPDGKWKLLLPAHFDLGDGFALRDFNLESGPQRLHLNLSARANALAIGGNVENLDLAQLPFLVFRGRQITGILNAQVAYREGQHRRSVQAQVDLQGLTADRLQVPTLRANAALEDSQLTAALDATFGAGDAHVRFTGPLPNADAGAAGRLNGNLSVAGLNIADFATLVPALKPYSGHLAMELGLGGDWALPRVSLTASVEQLQGPWIMPAPGPTTAETTPSPKPAGSIGPLSFEARFQTDERTSQLAATVIDADHPSTNLLDLKSALGVGSRQLGAFIRQPSTSGVFRDVPIQVAVETAALPLKALGRVVPDLSTARGTARLNANLEGSTRAPRGKLSLALRDFGFPHRPLGAVDLEAQAGDAGLTVNAKLEPPVDLGANVAAGVPPGTAGNLTLSAAWDLKPEDLPNASIRNHAALRADLLATNLPLSLLLGRRSELTGVAGATLTARGSLEQPALKSRVAITALQVNQKLAGQIAATADWDGQRFVTTVDGDQPSGGKIVARAEVPFTLSGSGNGPLSARVQAHAFDLSILQPVLVQAKIVRALAGVLDADLTVSGTREKPVPNGSLALTQGELALAGLGDLQHIQVRARIDPDSLVVDELSASSAGGPLTGKLAARRSDAGGFSGDFSVEGHLEANQFGIYLDDQLRALLSTKADLSGKLTLPGPGADVTVAVREASVHIPSLTQRALAPTALDPDIHISSFRPPESLAEATPEADHTTTVEATTKPKPPIYLRVSAPGPIQVRGPDIRLDAKTNLDVRLAATAEMTGLVSVDHGEINALGRTFTVYRANIRFGDGKGDFAPPGAGRLDIQAGQEVGGYKVSLVVLGRVDHPVPQLTSDPPLPRAQIGQLLATGSNDADSGAQVSGGSLVSNLFVEGLKTWLKVSPPLDVLTVDPNRLEAGKRITQQLYLGVTNNYAVMDPRVNGTEVHARYDLGNHFALDGRYGTSQAGSFDLQWRHNW